MRTKFLFLLLLSLIFFSCDNDDKERFSIELDETSVTIDVRGGEERITLAASADWSISDVPEWLTVEPSDRDSFYSTTIVITAKENEDLERRNASVVFTCGDASQILEVEQLGTKDLAPFIEPSKNTLPVGDNLSINTIKLTTNTPWKIGILPAWISVSPTQGEKSAELTITVKENKDPDGRMFDLRFEGEKAGGMIRVSQIGLKDYIRTPSLPIFSFKSVQFTGELDKYDIHAFNLFVNPGIKNKIYLGNLIAYDAGLPSNQIPEFTGYTFNPITISTSAYMTGIDSKTYIPSWNEQNAYAQDIIAKKPSQSLNFVADNGTTEFYDYKRLYTLGMANLGVKLDEVVSGASYTTMQMPRKYGLIFSFKQTWFSLDMDFPEKLIQEELKDADKAMGVAYVNSVYYGRVGLLIVESDTYFSDVKIAINKAISGQSLSAAETTLVEQSDISYVYFDNNSQVQVKKGKMDAVNAYKEAATKTNTENTYPVGFNLSNLIDNGTATISFSFKVLK